MDESLLIKKKKKPANPYAKKQEVEDGFEDLGIPNTERTGTFSASARNGSIKNMETQIGRFKKGSLSIKHDDKKHELKIVQAGNKMLEMLHIKDKKEEKKKNPEDLELDTEMEEVLTDRRRSIKWISHLSDMLPLDGNRDPKIRERARKGIPNSMRCLVW